MSWVIASRVAIVGETVREAGEHVFNDVEVCIEGSFLRLKAPEKNHDSKVREHWVPVQDVVYVNFRPQDAKVI